MMKLPYAIEVEHQGLKYGVVHAGIPEGLTWDEFIHALEDNSPTVKFECVWLRNYIEYKDWEEYKKPLEGVDFTIHGHTPVKEPLMVGNRLHIDTGLVYGKYLTITEAIDGDFKHHTFNLVEGKL